MGHVAETIRRKLQEAFDPERLEVSDESHKHAGHAGAPDGGESHFDVVITAAAFKGRSRVLRQRDVYSVLKDELSGPVHALSVKAIAPGE
jgi:BolA protein